MVIPIAVSRVATPENKVQLIDAVIHMQESRYKVPKSVLRAVLRGMQFTLHASRRTPHGASRLVQAMSAWLVKLDVLRPGIVGMRGSIVIMLCEN